ncbi:nickel-responsive transcriptional regulator NikR [Roseospira goensis]|uniref:Putative nickel-responsive regulator n=1 Tax=Roseospira goensis TaxID=391922 RepID=A0A7W6WL11_9PROT|nr:CopG family nickel-responsive transcriptional regulator [Roseospira goensis]
MERVTISLEPDLLAAYDALVARRGYTNRSEAMRDLLRGVLRDQRLEDRADSPCVGCLVYIYDHTRRDLARRLVTAHHDRHDLGIATTHVHIDHDHCMESVMLRGPAHEVRAFADAVLAQPGVWSGHLHLVPVDARAGDHAHGTDDAAAGTEAEAPAGHLHPRPLP